MQEVKCFAGFVATSLLDLFHKSRGRLEVKVAVVQRSEEVEPQAVSLTTVAVFR